MGDQLIQEVSGRLANLTINHFGPSAHGVSNSTHHSLLDVCNSLLWLQCASGQPDWRVNYINLCCLLTSNPLVPVWRQLSDSAVNQPQLFTGLITFDEVMCPEFIKKQLVTAEIIQHACYCLPGNTKTHVQASGTRLEYGIWLGLSCGNIIH